MPISTLAQPFITTFYSPTSPVADPSGRTLASILFYKDAELENHHDYIQLLFPLPEASPFNPFAPVIDEPTFTAFRSSPELRSQLLQAWIRMLHFYGFIYTPTAKVGQQVQLGDGFWGKQGKGRRWLMRFNHNHLRITRILRSLRVLGSEEQAEEFWAALLRLRELRRVSVVEIGDRSYMYWERAMRRPLWISPDEDFVPPPGTGWLWEWEQQQGEMMGKAVTDRGTE